MCTTVQFMVAVMHAILISCIQCLRNIRLTFTANQDHLGTFCLLGWVVAPVGGFSGYATALLIPEHMPDELKKCKLMLFYFSGSQIIDGEHLVWSELDYGMYCSEIEFCIKWGRFILICESWSQHKFWLSTTHVKISEYENCNYPDGILLCLSFQILITFK